MKVKITQKQNKTVTVAEMSHGDMGIIKDAGFFTSLVGLLVLKLDDKLIGFSEDGIRTWSNVQVHNQPHFKIEILRPGSVVTIELQGEQRGFE